MVENTMVLSTKATIMWTLLWAPCYCGTTISSLTSVDIKISIIPHYKIFLFFFILIDNMLTLATCSHPLSYSTQ